MTRFWFIKILIFSFSFFSFFFLGTVAERLRNILQDLGPAATRKKRVVVPQTAQKAPPQ